MLQSDCHIPVAHIIQAAQTVTAMGKQHWNKGLFTYMVHKHQKPLYQLWLGVSLHCHARSEMNASEERPEHCRGEAYFQHEALPLLPANHLFPSIQRAPHLFPHLPERKKQHFRKNLGQNNTFWQEKSDSQLFRQHYAFISFCFCSVNRWYRTVNCGRGMKVKRTLRLQLQEIWKRVELNTVGVTSTNLP